MATAGKLEKEGRVMSGWREVSEARFDEMLGMLPPAAMTGLGFLVGEAMRHNAGGQPEFTAFAQVGARFYEAEEPMTIATFKALDAFSVGEAP
jgi:hypothetical protein